MRVKITFLVIVSIFISVTILSQPVFRWDVKTLTDDSGIDWLQALQKTKHGRFATIAALTKKDTQFPTCHDQGLNTRRGDEKRVVKLQVRLIRVKKETNDNDYHIVIQSLDKKSQMVAEIPDPDQDFNHSINPELKTTFSDLRNMIHTLLNKNVTTAFKDFPKNTVVIIYGVPFWDCKHPGEVSGAAKDFREIHPVLEIDQ